MEINKVETVSIILIKIQDGVRLPDDFLRHYHTHIFCHRGSINFLFNDRPYIANAGEFVFWFADSRLSDLTFSKNIKATALLIQRDFLDNSIPDQSLGFDATLYSIENPILHLNDKADKQRVLLNFNLLHAKFLDSGHRFYNEILKLQMQLFLFEMWHTFSNELEHRKRTLVTGTHYERFVQLVQEHCMKEREVQFYANQLHLTAKYLNYVCKQNTGATASEWIQRYVRERIILLLQNKNLNISEIADEMNFSSRSFFTRYVKKIVGVTPREFRNRLG